MSIKDTIKKTSEELSSLELNRIKRLLGRSPNSVEMAIISALWSERCSYKSTKAHLSKLASSGLRLPVGPGEPGALIDLGNDLALVLKLDATSSTQSEARLDSSRLVRELAAMGARPVAVARSSLSDRPCSSVVVGLLNKQNLPAAKASGIKNRVLHVGVELEQPDPDVGKRLMQACQTCLREQLVVGLSSVGIAGLALACFGMANRASTGLWLNLDEISKIPVERSTEHIMLSECPERMIMVAQPQETPLIKEIFRSLNLSCDDIGRVCGDGLIRISHQGHEVINLPATLVMENAPRYRRQYHSVVPRPAGPPLVSQIKYTVREVLSKLAINTVDSGPAIIQVPSTQTAMALSWLTHPKLVKINPLEGGKRAVCQGVLEVSALGAKAQGIGFSLNFGPPEDEARMTEFKHAIDGAAFAASTLHTPIISANISVAAECVAPELAVAVIGLVDAQGLQSFMQPQANHMLVSIGDLPTDYCGTEEIFRCSDTNPPLRSWELEGMAMLSQVARLWVQSGKSHYVRALNQGGLYQALLNIMTETGQGIRLDFGPEWLADELLLGLLSEDSPRILLSVPSQDLPTLLNICAQKVPIYVLGQMSGEDFLIYHQGRLVYEAKNTALAKNPCENN